MVESSVPWKVESECVLVIPDIHQRIDWAKEIIAREEGKFTHLVFLGDFADSRELPPQVASIEDTALFYREMIERPDTTVLLGNHEAPIRESWSHNRHYRVKRPLRHGCSGFTNSKSQTFNHVLTWAYWQKVQLFVHANGWLISHAGVHPKFWRSFIGVEENLGALWRDCSLVMDLMPFESNLLLECGAARQGVADVGGLIWCDFSEEFKDNEVLPPQLCGHSFGENVRRKGRSYCIDTGQKSYALISRDGTITLKSLVKTVVSGTWVEEDVKVEAME